MLLTKKSGYWRWRIGSAAALVVLESILPFLVGKRDVAACAISFQQWWRLSVPTSGHSMSPERRAGAELYHAECRRLIRLYRDVPEGRVGDSPAFAEVLPIAAGSERR